MKQCPKCEFQTDEAGMVNQVKEKFSLNFLRNQNYVLLKVGANHLVQVHKLTSTSMKENPKEWRFRTVRVPAL